MGIKNGLMKIIKFFHAKEKIPIPILCGLDTLLKNKVALIIGGSSGIGLSIAKRILSAGGKVIIASSNSEKIEQCCKKIANDNVKGIAIDITDIKAISSKIEIAAKLFPESRIDILINCAGYNPQKQFFETTEEDFDKTINTNVKGTFFMTQAVSEYMIKNRIRGHILNVSSSSALRPAWSSYEISKWAIRGMTIGMADILIPYGIVVNAIAPGPTATPMLGLGENQDIDLPSKPIGRYSSPDEIANLALILVSDISNIVIGDTLYATGGSGVISLHK